MKDGLCRILAELGVPLNSAGFLRTAYAVMLALDDMESLLLVTKRLYPEVARRFNTSPAAVERSIRAAASAAWANNPELMSGLANCVLARAPTASQFISILVSYLSVGYSAM